MMSKAKWFAVRKPSTGGGPTKMLSPDPPFLLQCCSVEGRSGDETNRQSA